MLYRSVLDPAAPRLRRRPRWSTRCGPWARRRRRPSHRPGRDGPHPPGDHRRRWRRPPLDSETARFPHRHARSQPPPLLTKLEARGHRFRDRMRCDAIPPAPTGERPECVRELNGLLPSRSGRPAPASCGRPRRVRRQAPVLVPRPSPWPWPRDRGAPGAGLVRAGRPHRARPQPSPAASVPAPRTLFAGINKLPRRRRWWWRRAPPTASTLRRPRTALFAILSDDTLAEFAPSASPRGRASMMSDVPYTFLSAAWTRRRSSPPGPPALAPPDLPIAFPSTRPARIAWARGREPPRLTAPTTTHRHAPDGLSPSWLRAIPRSRTCVIPSAPPLGPLARFAAEA